MSNKKTGNVYWAHSKKIDKTDLKDRRQYVVVRDSKKSVAVAKIRGENNNSRNEERLYPLNMKKYPLSKPSGVDKKVYHTRSDRKPLRLEDKEVFDKEVSFKLSSHDTYRVLKHTGTFGDRRKNKKGRKL